MIFFYYTADKYNCHSSGIFTIAGECLSRREFIYVSVMGLFDEEADDRCLKFPFRGWRIALMMTGRVCETVFDLAWRQGRAISQFLRRLWELKPSLRLTSRARSIVSEPSRVASRNVPETMGSIYLWLDAFSQFIPKLWILPEKRFGKYLGNILQLSYLNLRDCIKRFLREKEKGRFIIIF